MGDPFSIATGVAGLISLGITVCDGLHTYFSAIKDRKEDLAIVAQNVALFEFHVFAVQSSASKLGHRHSPAIDGLQLSLINCEMQLQCLQKLLNELMPTEDPSLFKEIWRRQKLIARYPFDRKKLVQFEEYLTRANTTLSSFIQALNLDLNIRMGDELEAFRTSLEALDINTPATLRTIATKLDVSPKVEPITLQLLPSRIEDVTASSSNSIGLHQNGVSVAETKTSYSGNRRSFEDITDSHSTPRYLQNAELEQRLCKKLADMDCTCGALNNKTSNRPASWTYRFWGGLTVSRQGDTRANHRPGCIFFRKSKRNISKASATYFGLLSLFSHSFTVSFTQDYPGGPYSVFFGLRPCNIVESSPAFELFEMQSLAKENGLDYLADSVIKELRVIYGSGNASPFDVDQHGNNVAHLCLEAFLFCDPPRSTDIATDAICKILSYLADVGVPITASTFNQSNLLTLSMWHYNLWVLPRLYKLVMVYDSNFYNTELANRRFASLIAFGMDNGEKVQRRLKTLFEYPDICEDIGFSELFLAVITKDHRRLQAILAEEDSLLTISQTDLYGRNILHASCNWPDGLRLLLQRQDVRLLMEMAPFTFPGLSPLYYALIHSKIHCKAPDQWTECDDCTCYVGVQLLLEADCKVTAGYIWGITLADCSLKARKLFFKHLKDRRQRLRNMALSILPERILRQYGVSTSPLPDKTAFLLWSELQEAQDQQDHRIWVPDSLNPCNNNRLCIPESLFGVPHHPFVVEMALDYGFAPRDENGVQPLLYGRHIIQDSSPEDPRIWVKYLDWLLGQNLCSELSLGPFRLSILHRIAYYIGLQMRPRASGSWRQDVWLSELQDSRTLLTSICDSKSECNIPCPCSSGIFTRPLAHILPALLLPGGGLYCKYFFSVIENHIEHVISSTSLLKISESSSESLYMAKCGIHILTMMSLGVRHLPICLTEGYGHLKDSDFMEEEWKEILDEDRELIDQLEALDEEFGDVFDRQNVPIAEFLSGYWLTRMAEVIQELHKPLTHHDRHELLEAGVVLEEDNADGSEC
ncbi:uncharacterized protein FFNC_14794 [Fusarium fujikuroi]|nr:uncharacterized protein FFC1_03870 [Fusarium fujikuroi]SCO53352.1 uncharacterized protein FFNC_14794 [Fusarium fujikuroi]SCV59402.1 uncharacterized protein FFFS_13971 [Fusarium fujikuroi]